MTYRIADEPQPTGLANYAVEPFWPLLALMLGGAWIAWPWFVFNAFAFGSSSRNREAQIVAGTLALTIAAAAAVLGAEDGGLIPEVGLKYLVLAFIVLKLAAGYWLHTLQSRSFEIFKHFGGMPRNAVFLLIASTLLRGSLLKALPDLWILVLA